MSYMPPNPFEKLEKERQDIIRKISEEVQNRSENIYDESDRSIVECMNEAAEYMKSMAPALEKIAENAKLQADSAKAKKQAKHAIIVSIGTVIWSLVINHEALIDFIFLLINGIKYLLG